MFDEKPNESLERANNRPVNHDRSMLGVIGADVLEVEPLGHLVIELERRALPLPSNGIGHIDINLWPVKRAVTFVDRVRVAGALERLLQRRFGMVPRFDGAEELGRTR